MKLAVFVLLLIQVVNSYSQPVLYITPKISTKASITSQNLKSEQEWFSISSSKFFLTKANPILIGINLGMNLKDKNFIEFEISQDYSVNSYTVTTNIVDETASTYFNKEITSEEKYYNSSLIKFTKFSVSISKILFQKFRLYGTIGLGLGLQRNADNMRQFSTTKLQLKPNTNMTIFSESYLKNSISEQFLLGVRKDIVIKNRYWCSIELLYLLSRRTLSEEKINISINNNGIYENATYIINSKGSGIYFSISKRINSNSFNWNKKH